MRLFLCTLAPMLAAAILALVGGERLSRRENVDRTPHDRERLLDFSAALQLEVQRLESLYLTRLDNITSTASYEPTETSKDIAAKTLGISLVKIFQNPKKSDTLRITDSAPNEPEVLMEEHERAFNPQQAVFLSEQIFSIETPPQGIWLSTPNPSYRVHYRTTAANQIIAFLIDYEVITNIFREEIQTWIATPALPLVESEERVEVRFQETNLLSSGPTKSGPSAAIVPFRTIFGDLEIRAWDGLETNTYRDPTTVILSTVLALFLLTSGAILYWHQRQALRLAGERVSFVNRVSHELGSPLTNRALNIDLAKESLQSNPTQARKRLSIVTEEIERLSRLVANVLTFSHQEKDSLELHEERALAHEIISEVIDSFRPSFERKHITIETDLATAQPSLFDPDALRQIIGNLLSNIEKYASSGKHAKTSLLEKDKQLIIEVSDRGPGIPHKEKERIFQPFERVHHRASEGSSGTGLGLAIARDLATRMNGTLELIENKSGCTFRLTLPAKQTLSVVDSDSDAA